MAQAVVELKTDGNVEGIVTNLQDREAVKRLIERLQGGEGFDYLVNAAGIFAPKPFWEHTPQDYDSYLELNRATSHPLIRHTPSFTAGTHCYPIRRRD